MEEHTILIALSLIAVLGVGAQWLAWRIQLPSILFLLFIGFIAGNMGWINTDELFGELLFPVVSMSVGLILFEGGLSLKLRELKSIGGSLLALITIGPIITWLLSTLSAFYILKLSLNVSLLLGAILVVTGPTVIIPLLQLVRPKGSVDSLLKWEGILIDPIGATLALLVFEVIQIEDKTHISNEIFLVVGKTLFIGIIFGFLGGWFLLQMLRRFWIPDQLQNPVTLMSVLAVFAFSNVWQEESGLLSVIVMGIVLANQHHTHIHHIVEFKENLRVLLISSLFIVLAARVELDTIRELSWTVLAFVLICILIVRPLAVLLSTVRSNLTTKEKIFLAWMAPRGIVAAAVSSIFSLHLVELGFEEAAIVPPITFLVIVGTVLIYGLTAKPLALRLGLAEPNPKGILFVGSAPWVLALAEELDENDIPVLMVDSNRIAISAARMAGLRTYYGSALSERAIGQMDFSGIGRALALTPNDETNALVCVHYATLFGRSKVYQLDSQHKPTPHDKDTLSTSLEGRTLFDESVSFKTLTQLYAKGAIIKKTGITEEFSYQDYKEMYHENSIPIIALTPEDTPVLFTQQDPPTPGPGYTIYSLTLLPEPVTQA